MAFYQSIFNEDVQFEEGDKYTLYMIYSWNAFPHATVSIMHNGTEYGFGFSGKKDESLRVCSPDLYKIDHLQRSVIDGGELTSDQAIQLNDILSHFKVIENHSEKSKQPLGKFRCGVDVTSKYGKLTNNCITILNGVFPSLSKSCYGATVNLFSSADPKFQTKVKIDGGRRKRTKKNHLRYKYRQAKRGMLMG